MNKGSDFHSLVLNHSYPGRACAADLYWCHRGVLYMLHTVGSAVCGCPPCFSPAGKQVVSLAYQHTAVFRPGRGERCLFLSLCVYLQVGGSIQSFIFLVIYCFSRKSKCLILYTYCIYLCIHARMRASFFFLSCLDYFRILTKRAA